ncbi:MAG: hypothetical protein ABIN95_08585 [Mucilaginibacter sp.]
MPEKYDSLGKIAWEQSLSLNYIDTNNEIAEKYMVYAENSPTLEHLFGINGNIPLLATYVIDTSKQVAYHHAGPDFERHFPPDILSAVYHSAVAANSKRSA